VKSSTSCRVCRHWLEGDWNLEHAGGRRRHVLDAIQRQMNQGHCDGCTPFTGPRIWPSRKDLMESVTGYTKAPFAISTDRPALIGHRNFAVLIWADRRGATVAGEATARWWTGGSLEYVRVDGRITTPGMVHAFGLEAVLAAGPVKDGTHAAWSTALPGVQYRRRRGGTRLGDVQVTVVLAHLPRPEVAAAEILHVSIIPGSLRVGPIPR